MAAHGKSIPQGDSFQGRYPWAPVRAGLIAAGVASVIVATISPKVSGYVAHFQPHAPDFARIADAPLVIRVTSVRRPDGPGHRHRC
jgi:hypothetical protein